MRRIRASNVIVGRLVAVGVRQRLTALRVPDAR